MTEEGSPPTPPSIEDFLDEPSRRLEDWRWLWAGDQAFPIRSHRGPLGQLIVAIKRLFRPLVVAPQKDLWERQRVFNLILLEKLAESAQALAVQEDRVAHVEALVGEGLDDVMRHNDALFSRVDQKLDQHRRQVQELIGRLGAALARSQSEDGTAALRQAYDEAAYVAFEARFRGTEDEIKERARFYLPYLASGPVLDLGCGRGEALDVFREKGLEVRGVDSSSEMVALCQAQGLDVVQGDLLEALAAQEPGSLGAVVSLHVIEHLPPTSVERLVRLAFGALKPGGVLLLETPNPLSLVVAARSFWLDPTHVRPVHPDFLVQAARQVGFESAERLDLHPFAPQRELPEMPLPEEPGVRELADAVNRLRDELDALLFGYQDYALLARRGPA